MIRWYYAHPKTREQVGPCEEREVRELFVSGGIRSDTLVWHEGIAEWIPAGEAFLAYDPELGEGRARVPGRLAGWMWFDSVILWLMTLQLVLVPFFWPVAVALGVAAWWLWKAAGTLKRMPSVSSDAEVVLIRLRGVFAGLGWAAIICILLALLLVLLVFAAMLAGYYPEGGLSGLAEILRTAADGAASAAGGEG